MVDCSKQAINKKGTKKYKDLGDQVIGKIAKEIRDIRESSSSRAEFNQRVKEFSDALKKDKARIIKMTRHDQKVMAKAIGHIEQPDFKNKVDAIASIVSDHITYPTEGGSYSIESAHRSMYHKYMHMITSSFEEKGLTKVMVKGGLDKEIRLAMWDLEATGKIDPHTSQIVKDAVEIINKTYNGLQFEMEASGGTRGRRRGYLRRAYDYDKVGEVTRDTFVKDVIESLEEGSFDDLKLIKSIESVYDTMTGSPSSRIKEIDESTITLMRGGGLDARISKSRKWKFAREKEHGFMEKYGRGNVLENLISTIDRDSRNAATIERLGHKPHATFTALMDRTEKSLSGKEKKAFIAKRQHLYNLFEGATVGFTSGSSKLAEISTNLRMYLSAVHLGGSIGTVLPTDLMAQSLVHAYGTNNNLFKSLGDSVYNNFKMISKENRKIAAERMQIQVWDTVGEAMTRFGNEAPLTKGNRKLRQFSQTFYKLNLMSQSTSLSKQGGVNQWGYHAGDLSKFSMKELEKTYPVWASDLKRYNISASDWDAIRATGEDILGHKMISAYSIEQGVKDLSPEKVRDLRLKFTSLVQSKGLSLGNPNPGVYEKVMAGQLVDPNTVQGQVIRSFMQFKQFPMVMSRVRNSILNTPGGNRAQRYITFQAAMFAAGITSIALSSLMMGETMPDLSLESVLNALKKGGGFGLWGDFLIPAPGKFSDKVVGPAGTLATRALGLVNDTFTFDYADRNKFKGSKATRFVYDYTLGIGTKLPYTKAILHNLAFEEFMMMIDPRSSIGKQRDKIRKGVRPLFGD